MSGAKRSISVTRTYRRELENCARALELLLKKPVGTEGSPSPATLDNDGTRIEGDSADGSIIR